MPTLLEGACRCGAVRFSVQSRGPYPFMRCYCSICRKTAGAGGYAINLIADAGTMKLQGEAAIGVFHAEIRDEDGTCRLSSGERRYCTRCGSPLWVSDPEWPDLVHPHASIIDTDLPTPPSSVHIMLKYKASWVEPQIGPDDAVFDLYPDQSIEDWHRQRSLWG